MYKIEKRNIWCIESIEFPNAEITQLIYVVDGLAEGYWKKNYVCSLSY